MPPSDSALSRKAIGWALMGQAIWLPVLLIAVHDRWLSGPLQPASTARSQEAQGRLPAPLSLSDVVKAAPPAPTSRIASPQPLLPATLRLTPPTAAATGTAARAGWVLRSPAAPPSRPTAVTPHHKPVPAAPAAAPSVPAAPTAAAPQADRSRRGASPSQLLGGTLALRDLPDAQWRRNTPASPGAAAPSAASARSTGGDRP